MKPWRFAQSPQGIWSKFHSIKEAPKSLQVYLQAHGFATSADFQRHVLFETVGMDFNHVSFESIYALSCNFFLKNGLGGLLSVYDNSPYLLLSRLYPGRDLKPWKFTLSLNGIWSSFQSIETAPSALQAYLQAHDLSTSSDFQRHVLFETFGVDLNIAPLEEIYILNGNFFRSRGLSGLLSMYDNSPFLLLSRLFPGRELKPWKLAQSLSGIWSDFQSMEEAPTALRAYLQAHDLSTSADFKRHVLLSLCREYNVENLADCTRLLSHGLLAAHGIQRIQPSSQSNHEFMSGLFGLDKLEGLLKRKTQAFVTKVVRDLFDLSNDELHINYKSKRWFYTNRRNPQKRGYAVEFDIYVPKIRLAIEVHGIQHSQPINYFGGEEAFASQQARDLERRELVRSFNEANGDRLIFIEIWHSDTRNKAEITKNIIKIIESHMGDSDWRKRILVEPEFIL